MRAFLLASAVLLAASPVIAKEQVSTGNGLQPTAQNQPGRIQTASYKGLTFQVRSMIVGQTSTGTVASGGNPIYLPTRPEKDGVAGLLMTYQNGDQFVCSGSLASDRQSIVTAAHCVSSGGGVKDPNLVKTEVIFWNGSDTNQIWFEAGVTKIDVTDYFVRSGYTGDVIDQNDIAVLRMASAAPDFAVDYDLYTSDIEGLGFNVAGYGARSNTGGAVGANLGTGRLREGDNIYDYRFGNSDFGTEWAAVWGEPFEQLEYSYISDFDRSGFAANDASNLVANALGAPLNKYAQTGVGAREVGIAGGDSGGPGFVDGKLASVNSWGGTFGAPEFGDVDAFLNSSWGEFSGYVPIFIHADWINSVLVDTGAVPEPSTWAMLISGFGFAGFAMRRRRTVATVSA